MQRHTHLGIYAVATTDGQLLLVRKGRGPYTGCWDLPGGRIEHGEEPIEALRREMIEETGLGFTSPTTLGVLSHRVEHPLADGTIEDLHHIGIIVRVVVESDEPRHGPDGEDALEASWIAVDEIAELPLTPFAARAASGDVP